MKEINLSYKKHILVCVNERELEKESCGRVDGQKVYEKIKEYVKNNGLTGIIWVTRTRCLGFCNPIGTTIVIYPERKWFIEVTLADLEQITKELV